jgi:glycerol-3-phosphate dehydrogenase
MTRTTINEPAREIPVLMEADLVVVGGGTTGPIAAIAAALRGVSSTLSS